MNDNILKEMAVENNFIEILNILNQEIKMNIEYYLLHISSRVSKYLTNQNYKKMEIEILTELYKGLINSSTTFREQIFDNVELFNFFHNYCKKVLNYYNVSMNLEQDKFDKYVESSSKMPKIKEIKSENLEFTMEHIQNTMKLLNEALRVYYEVYNNRTLIATFSDEQRLSFKIKEQELAHLLGVSFKNIVNDKRLVDALKITDSELQIIMLSIQGKYETLKLLDPNGSAVISILHKFVDTKNGNLFEYEEDRLNKIKNGHNYETLNFPKDQELTRNFQVYSKMNMKSKAFLKFKPLEELSMLLSMPDGLKLIEQSKKEDSQYDVLISKANLTEKYKYATLLNNVDRNDNNRRYFESLLVKQPSDIENMKETIGTKAAITKEIISEPDTGTSGSTIHKIFSDEEQQKFIAEVYRDFNKVNFTELIEYFSSLTNNYNQSDDLEKSDDIEGRRK